MNLIYTCVFNNEKYLDLFYLLLESIQIAGFLDETIDLLVYTSSDFMVKIQNHPLYMDKLLFAINDHKNTNDLAFKARLDLFQFPRIEQYEKILYIDTDILILRDIKAIFDIVEKEVIYALEEGNLITDKNAFFYGGSILFTEDEINSFSDKSCFSSGVMLFKNCSTIKLLFDSIHHLICEKNIWFGTGDQPYIVSASMKRGLYDNKKLFDWVGVNDYNIYTNKAILHFMGPAGFPDQKAQNMATFLDNFKRRADIPGARGTTLSVRIFPEQEVPH